METNAPTPPHSPWFERVRGELHRDRSSLMKPHPASVNLAKQRQGSYDEQLISNRDYARDLTTFLPIGKDVLQKTRIAFFIDSTMKATPNMHYTLMDVRVMNLPCTSLGEMAEVTCNVCGPTSNYTETIPFPSLLIFSNVIDHLAVRGTLKHFEGEKRRLKEETMTAEVMAYVHFMRKVIRQVQGRRLTVEVFFVSALGDVHFPRQLQQFLYLVTEAAFAQSLNFIIVAPSLRVSAMTL